MNFTEIRRRTIIAPFSDDVLSDELVLKGGNAISLIYGFGGRTSLDLDFSIEDDFKDVDDIRQHIFTALKQKFKEVGFTVFDEKFDRRPARERLNAGQRWGGYQIEFKLIEQSKEAAFGGHMESIRRNALVVSPGQQRCFTVNLSKYEPWVSASEEQRNARFVGCSRGLQEIDERQYCCS
jgi:Nucleotidyl transferase AbiEii toxin, Type IV TA system